MDKENILLIEQAKKGDSRTFSKLYALYGEELYRFALYMIGSPEDAEDCVQEAALSAWQNISGLKDCSLFKPWLFKILSNKCKTHLMKKNKYPDTLPVEDYSFLSDTADGTDSFCGAEVKEALGSLTPPDAQIIVLSVIGGFKSREIGIIFDMPPETVRTRQKRALEKLRTILS